MDAIWKFFGEWDVDFCLASLPVLLLFLHFYTRKLQVPLKDIIWLFFGSSLALHGNLGDE